MVYISQDGARLSKLLSLTPSWLIYTISCVFDGFFTLFYDIHIVEYKNCPRKKYVLQFYLRNYEQKLEKTHNKTERGGLTVFEPACPFRPQRIRRVFNLIFFVCIVIWTY